MSWQTPHLPTLAALCVCAAACSEITGFSGPSADATSTFDGGADAAEPRVDASAGPVADSALNDAASGSDSKWFSPAVGTSWQWQLSGVLDTSIDVEVYDVDLADTSDAEIAELHAAGRSVICYFSAGSREDFRDDADQYAAADYRNPLDGWPGERWVDVKSENVLRILSARLDLAVTKGCDAVEPDNVDVHGNDTGYSFTAADTLEFLRWLASEAHARDLSVGLKNTLDLVAELEPDFDWALNEECLAFNECAELAPFLAANKAVFHTEYVDAVVDAPAKLAEVCADPSRSGFSTLVKTLNLDREYFACE